MKKILLMHGPNLNWLGRRDITHYGKITLKEIEQMVTETALAYEVEVVTCQSNHEGDLIDTLQQKSPDCVGIIINPGALTHYSYALHDALLDTNLPVVEVHLSNISEREDWRKISVTAPACIDMIEGKQAQGYIEAVHRLMKEVGHANLYSKHFEIWQGKRGSSSAVYTEINEQRRSQCLTQPELERRRVYKENWVIGYPLEHTNSPLLHNTVYEKLNILVRLRACPHPDIQYLIQSIKDFKVGLTAVTMPHKENALEYIDDCSEEVRALGAANTLIFRENKLYGYNTDLLGMQYAFRNTEILNRNILILGAGGAARAAGYCLQKAGGKLHWANRTQNKAQKLANRFGGIVITLDQIHTIDFDIIINTTPMGMHPNLENSPIPNYAFHSHQTVFDMVYNPVMTKLLKEALHSGAHTISGLDMFVAQGLHQIALWTEQLLPVDQLVVELKRDLWGIAEEKKKLTQLFKYGGEI